MKKTIQPVNFLLMGALALSLASSCAKKNGGEAPQVAPAPTAGATVDTNRNVGETSSATDVFAGQAGGSAIFVPQSLDVMNTYISNRPINNWQSVQETARVLVDLQDAGNGAWSGTVKIGYKDGTQIFTGTFSSGTGRNRVSYKNWYVGFHEAAFNQWFTWQGKSVFHGFFQDAFGAIVIVVDGGIDLGDGGGLTSLSGKIYFKNFLLANAPQYQGGSGEKCWFLLPPSPYECGTFKIGEYVSTTSALYPSNGYQLLGTFSGLDRVKAF